MRTFNCGIGFVLCVASDEVEPTLEILEAQSELAAVIGEIVTSDTVPGNGQLLIGA